MARVKKRGNKWTHRWRTLAGGQRRETFATKRAAEQYAAKVADAKAFGVDWRPEIEGAGAPSLEDMMVAYVAHSERSRAARTARNRLDVLATWLAWMVDRFGHPHLGPDVLTRKLLEEYDHHLAQRGHRKPCTITSRRIKVGVVCAFWRWAAEREEWDGFVPMPRRIEQPEPILASVHAATWAEVDTMISHLTDERHRRAAVLMRCTGLRAHQVVHLVDTDLDLERGTWTLRGELGKSRREKIGRVLPLPRALRDDLATWGRLPKGRLVRVTASAVRRAIREAWEASGLPRVYWAKRPLHAMRKTFRSELRRSGVESDAIEYWCGRRTGGQTDDYTDPRSLAMRSLAEAIPPLAVCAQGAPMLRLMVAHPSLGGG